MGNEMQERNHSPQVSDSHPIESPLEEQCQPDDPPVVQRLVKMGFKRKKALALYQVISKHEGTLFLSLYFCMPEAPQSEYWGMKIAIIITIYYQGFI